MNLFSDELCWILTDFKSGSINFAEADTKIRELIGRQFGLCLPRQDSNDILMTEDKKMPKAQDNIKITSDTKVFDLMDECKKFKAQNKSDISTHVIFSDGFQFIILLQEVDYVCKR